jgi:hypothetical protein
LNRPCEAPIPFCRSASGPSVSLLALRREYYLFLLITSQPSLTRLNGSQRAMLSTMRFSMRTFLLAVAYVVLVVVAIGSRSNLLISVPLGGSCSGPKLLELNNSRKPSVTRLSFYHFAATAMPSKPCSASTWSTSRVTLSWLIHRFSFSPFSTSWRSSTRLYPIPASFFFGAPDLPSGRRSRGYVVHMQFVPCLNLLRVRAAILEPANARQ